VVLSSAPRKPMDVTIPILLRMSTPGFTKRSIHPAIGCCFARPDGQIIKSCPAPLAKIF
jgi:hypothetical protein